MYPRAGVYPRAGGIRVGPPCEMVVVVVELLVSYIYFGCRPLTAARRWRLGNMHDFL